MELKLKVQKREVKENLGKDELAAVVYGRGLKTQALKLSRAQFDKVFEVAGESNLIEIDLDGTKTKTIVKEVQRHPTKEWVRHVDFYQVDMKQKIDADIPLYLVGESDAVKFQNGVLIQELNELSVECLPGDLLNNIDVDISALKELGDVIRVEDLQIPETMTSLLDNEAIVAMVTEVHEEEEPEVEEELEGEEGEEPKEGEEAEAGEEKDGGEGEGKAQEGSDDEKN